MNAIIIQKSIFAVVFLHFNHIGKPCTADLRSGIGIGISVSRKNGIGSFDIANAKYSTYSVEGFVGKIADGGPCNLETITFTPHGNSSHTECLGHISTKSHLVNDHIVDQFYSAKLVSLCVDKDNKNTALDFFNVDFTEIASMDALIIRSLPNSELKKSTNYSGLDTPYISTLDMQKIKDAGIKHLIIDLPSVDPEWDGGKLAAHHIFWNYPSNPRFDCSITEFVYISEEVKDGDYLVKLNISPFESDAAPCRPMLYPIIEN